MALPSTLGQPVPPPLPPWLVAWLRAHRSFIAMCQVRVAVGSWWRRRQHDRGSLGHPLGVAFPLTALSSMRPHSPQDSDIDRTTDGQRVNQRTFLWTAAAEAAHGTFKDTLKYYENGPTPSGRYRQCGSLPQSLWPMDHETRSAYVAHRAQQTRAAALSAFQTLPYMPSWRELAAARRQHGFIGLYEPI